MKNSINYIKNVLSYCYSNFYNEPWEIQLIWLCIPLFVVMIAILFLRLFFIRLKRSLQAKRTQLCKPNIEVMLLNVISTGNFKSYHNDLLELTKKNYQKEIAIAILMSLSNNVSGILKTNIDNLFVNLNLHTYTINKIKSRFITKKIRGIKILAELSYSINIEKILTPYLNHKNQNLRGEILVALVKLLSINGLKQLVNLKYDISDWHQIGILEALLAQKNIHTLNITPYLKSSNKSVIKIALKLMISFTLVQYKLDILPLLKHDDYHIRKETRAIVKYFKIVEAKDFLFNALINNNDNIELINIIDTIEALEIDFQLDYTDNNVQEFISNFQLEQITIP